MGKENTVKRMKRQSRDWEKIIVKRISDEGPIYTTYR